MNEGPSVRVTELLRDADSGDKDALVELFRTVEFELRKIASARAREADRNADVNTTMLVNEAYLKLVLAHTGKVWANREHFYRTAAMAMRQIVVDLGRKANTIKRGGKLDRIELDQADQELIRMLSNSFNFEKAVEISEAVESLAEIDPKAAEVVKLRYYGGCTYPEIASITGFAERTVKNHWKAAQAILFGLLNDEEE